VVVVDALFKGVWVNNHTLEACVEQGALELLLARRAEASIHVRRGTFDAIGSVCLAWSTRLQAVVTKTKIS
jgi:hypothetical protein